MVRSPTAIVLPPALVTVLILLNCVPPCASDWAVDFTRPATVQPPLAAMISALHLLTLLPPCASYSAMDVTRLLANLTSTHARARPVRDSTNPTLANFTFHLTGILQLDNVHQKLVSTGWFQVTWENEYTTWDPSLYGGVVRVAPDAEAVWRPRVAVGNTVKELQPIGEEYIIVTSFFQGTTVWFPAERFQTFCRVDVTYFPFDIQKCEWTLFSWGAEDPEELQLQQDQDTINLDTFMENGEWELLSTSAWKSQESLGGVLLDTLHYDITIRRRPALLVLTVLLPIVSLGLVNVLVFTIPSEEGERLAYSMTSLLSFGVFMSFIQDSMPSSTDTLSIVAVYLSSLLVLSAVHVLLCIVSLRLFHRDPDKHPVPPSVQGIVVCLEMMLCLDPPVRTNKVSAIDLDMNLSDLDNGDKPIAGRINKWAMTRKQKQEAYSDPKEMTWRRVSRSLDKLLFRVFFCVVLVTNCVLWGVMVQHYYQLE